MEELQPQIFVTLQSWKIQLSCWSIHPAHGPPFDGEYELSQEVVKETPFGSQLNFKVIAHMN